MTSKTTTPVWRQVFDAIEHRVAERAEGMIATDRFADAATVAMRATAPASRVVPTLRLPSPERAMSWVGGQIDKSLHRTRNGLRVLTGFGEPELATTPNEVVWERDRARLYRYHSAQRRQPVPVLLTMSLVSTPKVFDLRPNTSFVAYLLQAGAGATPALPISTG